jgi:hypothetical protein
MFNCFLTAKIVIDLPNLKETIMKYYRFLFGILMIFLLHACATQKLTKEGEANFEKGNYEAALSNLSQVISKQESRGKEAEPRVYYHAGMAAMKLGKTAKAREYLETAEYLEYPSPKLYSTLSSIYKKIDNLSKEIIALEDYHEKFPQGDQIDSINIRLFETYVQSENWQKAVDLWPAIESQAQSEVDLLAGYLTANKNLENNELCDKLAGEILEMDPDNITALEWYAKKYYHKANNLYESQMKAYKNNRTRSQYKKLMKAWKRIWPDFRKSRDYFKKLYSLNPSSEYAEFLGNIYTRMDKKKKAAYWYRRAK